MNENIPDYVLKEKTIFAIMHWYRSQGLTKEQAIEEYERIDNMPPIPENIRDMIPG